MYLPLLRRHNSSSFSSYFGFLDRSCIHCECVWLLLELHKVTEIDKYETGTHSKAQQNIIWERIIHLHVAYMCDIPRQALPTVWGERPLNNVTFIIFYFAWRAWYTVYVCWSEVFALLPITLTLARSF